MTTSNDDENRVRIYSVSLMAFDTYLSLFNPTPDDPDWPLTKWEFDVPVPDGARVLRCFYQWDRNTMDFVVEHESFLPVSEGMVPPRVYASNIKRIDAMLAERGRGRGDG